MTQAVTSVLSKYATFSGRAARSEYWWWALAYILILIVLGVIERNLLGSGSLETTAADGEVGVSVGLGLLGGLWSLATLVPGIAVIARRLHDIDRSGWWQLIALIPLIGWLILIVWLCKRGTAGENRFGADPLA